MDFRNNAAAMRHELAMARIINPTREWGMIGEEIVLANDPRLDEMIAGMEENEKRHARDMAEIGAMAYAARVRLHDAPFDAMQKLICLAAFIAVVQLVL